MRLVVTTPTALVVDAEDVTAIHAEDETGAFGIMPGHADFVTVLAVSVLSWHDRDGAAHHVALRGGALSVRGGMNVEVATRDAVGEDALETLGNAVLERFRAAEQRESESRSATTRLQLATIRQLQRYLQDGSARPALGSGGSLGAADDTAAGGTPEP